MEKGTLYGVGVGPGDPELMTYKAVRIINCCQVIAVPTEKKEESLSYKIANKMTFSLDARPCLTLPVPMTKDPTTLIAAYQDAVAAIEKELDAGRNVAYLTIGDPCVYSTYIYIHRQVESDGYSAQIVSGVPSICAAGAAAGDSLADRNAQIHLVPGSYDIEDALTLPGTKVIMKAASKMPEVKRLLAARAAESHQESYVTFIENCTLPKERIIKNIDDIPDDAGYFSILIVKDV